MGSLARFQAALKSQFIQNLHELSLYLCPEAILGAAVEPYRWRERLWGP
jgi:hypothetical protein